MPGKLTEVATKKASSAHLLASAAVLIARVTGEDFPGDLLILHSKDGTKGASLTRLSVDLENNTAKRELAVLMPFVDRWSLDP